MHPPSDPTRTYLSLLAHQELMREAARHRQAAQCRGPGPLAQARAALAPRMRALLSSLAARSPQRRSGRAAVPQPTEA